MPAPNQWPLLGALVGILVFLLVAGMAAAGQLLSALGAAAPWNAQLARFADRNPWRWFDLLVILALVGAAQLLRAAMTQTVTGSGLAFQGVLIVGLVWRARGKPQAFGASVPAGFVGAQVALRWLAVLPLLWFVAFTWQAVLTLCGHVPDFQEAVRLFLESDGWKMRAVLVIFAVVLAPLAEEGLFRGVLLPLLVRRTGAVAGMALTTVCFAGLHGNLGTFAPLAVLSVALSLAYVRTGTLWVPIGMHALFNAVSLGLMLALDRAGVL